MPLDPLEERQLLRGIIRLLADAMPAEAQDKFVERNVEKLNQMVPTPSKAQKRRFIRPIE